MLSLCSGTAGIERGILEAAGVPIEITLFDINENLLAQAADVVAPYARAFGVAGDVNTVSTAQFATRFDVVAFVSGLHHVVELEHVLQTVSSLLEEQGEFWLIGEQIGRNGNRLWPESREVVDRLFATLPEPFRRNAHSGAIDNTMPDSDFSSVTFEGIRCLLYTSQGRFRSPRGRDSAARTDRRRARRAPPRVGCDRCRQKRSRRALGLLAAPGPRAPQSRAVYPARRG